MCKCDAGTPTSLIRVSFLRFGLAIQIVIAEPERWLFF